MDHKQLAKEIHENAVEKGFWKQDSNQDEKIMLIISELGEAVEAHRKDRWASIDSFKGDHTDKTELFKSSFEAHIKDTIEDELADTYIRCLDYLQRYNKEYFDIPEIKCDWSDNFGENIFKIIRQSICDYEIDVCAGFIVALCKHMDIDLEWHVEQKMKYNSNRKKLHGKKY